MAKIKPKYSQQNAKNCCYYITKATERVQNWDLSHTAKVSRTVSKKDGSVG